MLQFRCNPKKTADSVAKIEKKITSRLIYPGNERTIDIVTYT